MKKRFLTLFIAIVMVMTMIPATALNAFAATTTGTTGDVSWSFDDTTGTLTVSGEGAMADYTNGSQPWYAHKDSIKTVIITKGVTTISTYAFYEFPALATVKIAGSVTAIGQNAFAMCENLTTAEYYGSSNPMASSNVFSGTTLFVVEVLSDYSDTVCCGKMARVELDAANEPVTPTGVASVTIDGTTTSYDDLADAIASAKAASGANVTVTLLKDVTMDGSIYINSGTFTIDLNGKTWHSTTDGLSVCETADVKITDTAGGGMISGAGNGIATIYLNGTGRLEIAGGTVTHTNDGDTIYMYESSGLPTLTVSGGKISTYLNFSGGTVKITGGTLEQYIRCYGSFLDLSDHPDPTGIQIKNLSGGALTVSDTTVKLPSGYALYDSNGNAVTTLADLETYTVGASAATTPTITGVSFNEDSAAYDSNTNTFNVSDETPFILTITGEKLSELAGNDFRALFYGDAQGSGGVIISVTVESDTRAYVSVNTSKLTYILNNAVGNGSAQSTKATSVVVENGDETVGTINVNLVHATTTPAIYTISVPPPTNGSVAVPASMAAGSTVTFTVTPNTNYEIDTITVSDGTNTIPPAPGQVAGAYTFTMPASDVTITATFKAKASIPATVTITEVIISDYQDSGVVTVDTPNKTYTITIPADQDRTTATVTVKGENLDKITDENSIKHILVFSYGGSIQLSPTNLQSSGDMVFNSSINQNKIGSTEMKYSTDGGTTWTPIGWTTVVQKASTAYTVTVDSAIENGAVTANSADASEGDTVILTATPADGYEVDTLAVTDENGGPVTVTNNTFTMPASNVTVTATFKKIEYATKTELEAAVAELNKAIEELEEASATANELSAVVSAVNTLKATMESTYATKAELKAVEDALKAADEALTAAVEQLTRDLAAANEKITANEGNIATNKADIAELAGKMTAAEAAIEALKTSTAATQAQLDALEKAFNEAKVALEEADKVLQDNIDTVKGELDQAIIDLNETIKKGDDALAQDISDLDAKLDAAKKELDAVDAVLKAADEQLAKDLAAAKKELEDKIAAAEKALLDALAVAKKELEDADAANKKELQDAIDSLSYMVFAKINKVIEDLTNTEKTLNDKIAANETKIDTEIETLTKLMQEAKAALEAADTANKKALEDALASAQDSLYDAITALEKKLNDTKAELEGDIEAGDKAVEDALKAELAAIRDELAKNAEATQAAIEQAKKDAQIVPIILASIAIVGCIALAGWIFMIKRKNAIK